MSNIKFSELSSATALNGSEIVPIVQNGDNKKTTVSDIAALADSGLELTATQLNAVNSGITSAKVATYDGYANTISGKQSALNATQLAAVNSGITSELVSQIGGSSGGTYTIGEYNNSSALTLRLDDWNKIYEINCTTSNAVTINISDLLLNKTSSILLRFMLNSTPFTLSFITGPHAYIDGYMWQNNDIPSITDIISDGYKMLEVSLMHGRDGSDDGYYYIAASYAKYKK